MGTEARKEKAKSEVYDEGGLYLRKGVYWADITSGGKRYRRSLKTDDRGEAQRRIDAMRSKILAGSVAEFSERRLADAIEPYLEEHVRNLKPKTQQMYHYGLKSLLEHMPNSKLQQIGRGHLLDYENKMRDLGLHTQTIINYLRVFSSLMEYAIAREWIEQNPCNGFIKARRRSGLRRSQPRKRYLSPTEEMRLMDVALGYDREARPGRRATRMYPRIVFAIATGLRDDEMRSLRWDDINEEQGYLTVREEVGKSGERRVPLTGIAVDMLKLARRDEAKSEYVFPGLTGNKADNFDKAWRTIRTLAGLDDVRWHDLRRTCGCRLLDRGFAMHEVQAWLGHASVVQTEQAYAFLRFDKLKGR